MAVSYMEFIYIDSDGNARHTNQRAAFDTNAETLAVFNSYRPYKSAKGDYPFILDYHNSKGDLGETLPMGAEIYEKITGEPMQAESVYIERDKQYWRDVKRHMVK